MNWARARRWTHVALIIWPRREKKRESTVTESNTTKQHTSDGVSCVKSDNNLNNVTERWRKRRILVNGGVQLRYRKLKFPTRVIGGSSWSLVSSQNQWQSGETTHCISVFNCRCSVTSSLCPRLTSRTGSLLHRTRVESNKLKRSMTSDVCPVRVRVNPRIDLSSLHRNSRDFAFLLNLFFDLKKLTNDN